MRSAPTFVGVTMITLQICAHQLRPPREIAQPVQCGLDYLKTTLRAEAVERAWNILNSETSRPFPRPRSGRIAVKVIYHFGEEVMKAYVYDAMPCGSSASAACDWGSDPAWVRPRE